jgi:hypothetical protein
MTRGDLVVVRAYGAKPLIRRVWEVTEQAVYISDEKNYQLLADGLNGLEPVGNLRKYVFIYDPATFPAETEGIPQDEAFWAQLQKYEEAP